MEEEKPNQTWTLHADGSSSKHGSGVNIRLTSPAGEILEQSLRLGFKASNNEAEYEALIAGMRLAQGLGIRSINAFCDSQLVANQFSGEYATKDNRMEAYLEVVKDLVAKFEEFTLTRIPRGENTSVDALAALASTSDTEFRRVIPVEFIENPNITFPETVNAITRSQSAQHNLAEAEIANRSAPIADPNTLHDTTRGDAAEPMDIDEDPSTDRCIDCTLTKEKTFNKARDPDDDGPDSKATVSEPMPTADVADLSDGWISLIQKYICDGDLPSDKWAARKLRAQAARFVLMDDNLFK